MLQSNTLICVAVLRKCYPGCVRELNKAFKIHINKAMRQQF